MSIPVIVALALIILGVAVVVYEYVSQRGCEDYDALLWGTVGMFLAGFGIAILSIVGFAHLIGRWLNG